MKRPALQLDLKAALRWVLVAQLLIAAILVFSDAFEHVRSPFKEKVELPTGPVSPGDQRRDYRTDRTDPTLFRQDDGPDISVPENFSERLSFSEQQIEDLGSVLLLSGEIEVGDAERVSSYLDEMTEKPDTVALHSPGGIVHEALSIGRVLRERGLSTSVLSGTICMSSCPYVLAGGQERRVSLNGVVGMHQHYYDQPRMIPVVFAVEGIQRGQGETMQYLIDMGVDPSLMLYSLNTPPEQIYALIEEELLETRLATQVVE